MACNVLSVDQETLESMQNALVTDDWSHDTLADFTSIWWAALPIQNFNFSHILEYCDVINDANGSNNDYRHVIIKGQHLLEEYFVTDLFKQDEIEIFRVRILRNSTPKCTSVSNFQCL